MDNKPLVGISTCLLGEEVRYDGGHKLDHYLRDVLGKYVEYFPVCPEVECGLSIPREAMRLVATGGEIKLMTQKSRIDMTPRMNAWMKEKLDELAGLNLCGFIFKSKSPSSGLLRVKVYSENGTATKTGVGIFAGGITGLFPLLPVEEDGRLNDGDLRENFIERIFIMQRWHDLNKMQNTPKNLMDFHASHKYILMAHCPKTLKDLGAIVAEAGKGSIDNIYDEYFPRFITALAKIATVRKNTNVLQHIMGYFKNELTGDERAELREIIEHYHKKMVPLIVPVTLLNHHVRKYNKEYLAQQYYLNPHPLELMLRNHV